MCVAKQIGVQGHESGSLGTGSASATDAVQTGSSGSLGLAFFLRVLNVPPCAGHSEGSLAVFPAAVVPVWTLSPSLCYSGDSVSLTG